MFSSDFSRLFDLRTLFSPLSLSGSSSTESVSLPDHDAPAMADMQYTNWYTCNHRPALMASIRRHKWCSLVDLFNFVEAHKMSGFHHHATRMIIVAALARLRAHVPVGQFQRFPDEEYVDLDDSPVKHHLDTLHRACDQNDRAANVGGAQPNGSASDAKRAFDVAFAYLRDFATAVDFPANSGVWTRESFEAHYALEWGAPAQNNQAAAE